MLERRGFCFGAEGIPERGDDGAGEDSVYPCWGEVDGETTSYALPVVD
jgi:hypothetical protein